MEYCLVIFSDKKWNLFVIAVFVFTLLFWSKPTVIIAFYALLSAIGIGALFVKDLIMPIF